jgi:hypothetical protein
MGRRSCKSVRLRHPRVAAHVRGVQQSFRRGVVRGAATNAVMRFGPIIGGRSHAALQSGAISTAAFNADTNQRSARTKRRWRTIRRILPRCVTGEKRNARIAWRSTTSFRAMVRTEFSAARIIWKISKRFALLATARTPVRSNARYERGRIFRTGSGTRSDGTIRRGGLRETVDRHGGTARHRGAHPRSRRRGADIPRANGEKWDAIGCKLMPRADESSSDGGMTLL